MATYDLSFDQSFRQKLRQVWSSIRGKNDSTYNNVEDDKDIEKVVSYIKTQVSNTENHYIKLSWSFRQVANNDTVDDKTKQIRFLAWIQACEYKVSLEHFDGTAYPNSMNNNGWSSGTASQMIPTWLVINDRSIFDAELKNDVFSLIESSMIENPLEIGTAPTSHDLRDKSAEYIPWWTSLSISPSLSYQGVGVGMSASLKDIHHLRKKNKILDNTVIITEAANNVVSDQHTIYRSKSHSTEDPYYWRSYLEQTITQPLNFTKKSRLLMFCDYSPSRKILRLMSWEGNKLCTEFNAMNVPWWTSITAQNSGDTYISSNMKWDTCGDYEDIPHVRDVVQLGSTSVTTILRHGNNNIVHPNNRNVSWESIISGDTTPGKSHCAGMVASVTHVLAMYAINYNTYVGSKICVAEFKDGPFSHGSDMIFGRGYIRANPMKLGGSESTIVNIQYDKTDVRNTKKYLWTSKPM